MWKQIGNAIDAAQRQNYYFGQEKYGWMHSANKRHTNGTKIKIMSAFGTNRKLTCIPAFAYIPCDARTPASTQTHMFQDGKKHSYRNLCTRVHQSQSQSQRAPHTKGVCGQKSGILHETETLFGSTAYSQKTIWKTIKQTTKITTTTKKIPLSQSIGPTFFRGWNFCLWSLYEHEFFNVAHIVCTSQVKLLFGRHTQWQRQQQRRQKKSRYNVPYAAACVCVMCKWRRGREKRKIKRNYKCRERVQFTETTFRCCFFCLFPNVYYYTHDS